MWIWNFITKILKKKIFTILLKNVAGFAWTTKLKENTMKRKQHNLSSEFCSNLEHQDQFSSFSFTLLSDSDGFSHCPI